MGNMSYCRFENTLNDLQDCLDNWELNEDTSIYESSGKKGIIRLAREIVEMEGEE